EPSVEEISVESSDAVAETIEEIRFYLEHSMVDQARAAYAKLQSQTADYEQLASIEAEINAASAPAEIESVEEQPAVVEEESPAPDSCVLGEFVADLENALGDGFLQEAPVATTEHPQAPPPTAQPKPAPAAAQADLHMAASAVSGASVIPTVAPVPPVAAPPGAAASATVQPSAPPSTFRASVRPANGPAASTKHDMAASVDLADMFGEIRHDL